MAAATRSTAADMESEVRRAEERLRNAMMSGDADGLGELLAADAVFTDQNGLRVQRADDLATHRSGLLAIDRLDTLGEPVVKILGDAAVVWVSLKLSGRFDGQPIDGSFAYTRVWHWCDGTWRVEAAHCSAMAAA